MASLGGSQYEADFSLTHTRCASASYCGFFPEATTVAGGASCGTAPGADIAWVGAVSSVGGTISEHDSFYTSNPSSFKFCMWAYGGGAYSLVAELPSSGGSGGNGDPAPGGGVGTAPVHTEPIPAYVGQQVDRYHLGYYKLNSDYLPAGLDVATYQALIARSGARWGLSNDGVSTEIPGVYDGVDTVGFSAALDAGTLGLTTIWRKLYYGHRKKRCHHVRRHRRLIKKCKKGKRYVKATRVLEEDTEFNTLSPWNYGPGYPDDAHLDLETVMIHEFGHFAGNEHIYGCRNSPMSVALDTGEWWHGVSDWRRFGCSASSRHKPSIPGAARLAGRLRVRNVIVDGPPRSAAGESDGPAAQLKPN